MQLVTMQPSQANSQKALIATLDELCALLSSFPGIQLSPQEREALAVAAIGGQPEAEFMVGCVFDAAGEPARAVEWYFRSAGRDYLPAMLQLLAAR